MTMQKFGFFNNNAYIRIMPIYQTSELTQLINNEICTTNISCPLSDFMNKLIEHEQLHNNSKKRGLNIRYGTIATFLLSDEDDLRHIQTLTSIISRKFRKLPFFSWISTEGKGIYLNFYVCEREFFPEGHESVTLATKSRYRNKKTGRLCTPETTPEEDLQLIYNAGDVIKSEIVYFSSKSDLFRFASQEHFGFFMAKLKNFWISILKKICKTSVSEQITFHQLSIKKSSKSTRANVIVINRMIKEIEDLFNNALYAIKFCECYDNKARKKLMSLYEKYNEFIKAQGCKYDGFKISLNPRIRNKEYLAASADLMLRKFRDDLQETFTAIIPQLCD